LRPAATPAIDGRAVAPAVPDGNDLERSPADFNTSHVAVRCPRRKRDSRLLVINA
jgi:hypothetical protein